MALRRDDVEWWYVIDKTTGQQIPDGTALSIIDQRIDQGFRVEVWAAGDVQGVSYIAPFAFQVEVTRLSNKK